MENIFSPTEKEDGKQVFSPPEKEDGKEVLPNCFCNAYEGCCKKSGKTWPASYKKEIGRSPENEI